MPKVGKEGRVDSVVDEGNAILDYGLMPNDNPDADPIPISMA